MQLLSQRRPFRIYLATGSSERLTTARTWIERLIAHGIEVHDWTRDPNWDLGRMPTESEFLESVCRDMQAIRGCDLFWYAVPKEKSEGAAAELMYALSDRLNKSIVGSGEFGSRNIFALLIPSVVRFPSHEAAFAHICGVEAMFHSRESRGEF